MSPVGESWRKSIANKPNLQLYNADESHPALEGSYLAACVFYEVLFRKSVLSNTYTAGLTATNVAFLQQVAHSVVNDSLLVWNIGKYLPCNTTGMQEVIRHKDIELYPNPAQTLLHTSTSTPYKIYDMLGHLCMEGANAEIISIENLKSGHYILELVDCAINKKLRFVKE
jgi:hypothetical protein